MEKMDGYEFSSSAWLYAQHHVIRSESKERIKCYKLGAGLPYRQAGKLEDDW
jgi:hypothetical protein